MAGSGAGDGAAGPGRLVAAGRSARVYDAGPGLVLRRRTDGGSSEREAGVLRWAERHGVPVPHVVSAAGPDLVMAAVPGPTLMDVLVADPAAALAVGRTLAGLHRLLDRVPAPPGLDARGPQRPQPAYLLHGDLHPGNVIDSPDGPVLIDWENASAGSRAFDVAESWLLISAYDPGIGGDFAAARAALVAGLLDGTAPDPTELRAVAAERLRDPNTSTAERDAIRRLVPTS